VCACACVCVWGGSKCLRVKRPFYAGITIVLGFGSFGWGGNSRGGGKRGRFFFVPDVDHKLFLVWGWGCVLGAARMTSASVDVQRPCRSGQQIWAADLDLQYRFVIPVKRKKKKEKKKTLKLVLPRSRGYVTLFLFCWTVFSAS
jgi:hypothetical protein